ncbi:Lipid-A-disaccharide synthase [Gammaproteobacteria bacterium]
MVEGFLVPPTKIVLVAGEVSGDFLGAKLIEALKKQLPHAHYEGVAGERMAAAGCEVVAKSDLLSVMGLVEVVKQVPTLWKLRHQLIDRWCTSPPDLFIGIDAPDFNLTLEQALRAHGIPTIHYVSPSVWAWRPWRVRKIRRAANLVLTLFPFEVDFYFRHGVDARFVGHPLADEIPLESDRNSARRALYLPEEGEIVALLPGSRKKELQYLATDFLAAAQWMLKERPGLIFVLPLANKSLRPNLEEAIRQSGKKLPLVILDGHSQKALAAANVALVASGTATLETLLVGRPMVVAYRVAPLTYRLVMPLLKIPYCSLPNLLAGKNIVPELIQTRATPESLGKAVLAQLQLPNLDLIKQFKTIHQELRKDASQQAALAVLEVLGREHHHPL